MPFDQESLDNSLKQIHKQNLAELKKKGLDNFTIINEKRFSDVYYYIIFQRLKREITRLTRGGLAIPGYGDSKTILTIFLEDYNEHSDLLTYRACKNALKMCNNE